MNITMHSLSVKIGIIGLLLLYVLVLFKVVLMGFKTDDQIPTVQHVGIAFRRKFRSITSTVKTGFYIKRFSEFDLANNRIVLDAVMWFEFNAEEITLSDIEKFSIDNGKVLEKSEPDVQMRGDNTFARFNVTLLVQTNLSFKRFPLEDHRIPIVMTNDYVTPNEMYFKEDIPFTMTKKLGITDWKVQKLTAKSGYGSVELDKDDKSKVANNPKVLYIIDFKRASIKELMVIFVPLFAALFFSLFTFLMNLGNYIGKFRLAVSSVTALLAYRFVIDRIMPSVGYFTTTDKLYIFFLLFCFFNFFFQLMMTRQYLLLEQMRKLKESEIVAEERTALTPKSLEKINSYVYVASSLVLVLLLTYFLIW